jgi:hypothetical protein
VEGRILEGKAWHDHPASALPGCGSSPELADHLEADHRRPRPILGYTASAGPRSPLDGRIVDLGLHRRVNPSMGNDVIITIAATSIRA